jgi:hypothetical protein
MKVGAPLFAFFAKGGNLEPSLSRAEFIMRRHWRRPNKSQTGNSWKSGLQFVDVANLHGNVSPRLKLGDRKHFLAPSAGCYKLGDGQHFLAFGWRSGFTAAIQWQE